MGEREAWFDRMRARFRLEHGLLAGGAIAGAGALIAAVDRPHLDPARLRRPGRGAAARRGLRADHRRLQVLFSSFLLSILGLRRRDGATASRLGARGARPRPARSGARASTSVDAELARRVEQHLEARRRARLDRLELAERLDLDAVEHVAAHGEREHVARRGRGSSRAGCPASAEIVSHDPPRRGWRGGSAPASRVGRRRRLRRRPDGSRVGRGARLVTRAVRPSSTANRTSSRRPSTRAMLAACTNAALQQGLSLGRACRYVTCQNQGAKGKSSARARRKATELRTSQPGCHQVERPTGHRDQGPGKQCQQAQRSLQEGSPTCSTSCAQRAQDEKGFTLIELLVVILIIGILAAIALPAFLGQRSRAQDTEAKSAVREAQTAMETYYTDNQNYVADKADLAGHRGVAEVRRRRHARPSPPAPPADRYTLTSTSKTEQHVHDRQGPPPASSRVPAPAAEHQGRLPRQPQLVVAQPSALREAGLRARLVAFKRQFPTCVQSTSRERPLAADIRYCRERALSSPLAGRTHPHRGDRRVRPS